VLGPILQAPVIDILFLEEVLEYTPKLLIHFSKVVEYIPKLLQKVVGVVVYTPQLQQLLPVGPPKS
jgi:hypothetical protein